MKKLFDNINFIRGCALVFFLLFILSFIKDNTEQVRGFHLDREINDEYFFTNPILDCEFDFAERPSLEYKEISSFIESMKKKYSLSHISVYYRDLNNGQWSGYEEKEFFSPSSMLKTPILIALLKYSENEPEILQKEVVVTKEDVASSSMQFTTSGEKLEIGKSYKMLDLAKKMVQDSDNVSARVIHKNIPQSFVDDVFQKVGVSIKEEDQEGILIRIKDLAAFWRVLFNASYLNRDNSELALEILSKTSYNKGIVSGVPKHVKVSHKFGERISSGVLFDNNLLEKDEVQLHDCGIVYYPESPYIMCVMTRGRNFEDQQKAIVEVSSFFYHELDQSIKRRR